MRASEEERRTREALRESREQLNSYLSAAAREGAYSGGKGSYRELVESEKSLWCYRFFPSVKAQSIDREEAAIQYIKKEAVASLFTDTCHLLSD